MIIVKEDGYFGLFAKLWFSYYLKFKANTNDSMLGSK